MIGSDDWEIIEQERVGMFQVDVYLINKSYQGKNVAIARFVGGQIELRQLKEGELEVEPTLRINLDIWRMIKASLIDKKVRDKNEVEAELGATKYHLEDMRKLLKLI